MDVCFNTLLHKSLSLSIKPKNIDSYMKAFTKLIQNCLHSIQSSILKINFILNRKAFLLVLQASRYLKGIKIWCIATLDHRGFYSWGQQGSPQRVLQDPMWGGYLWDEGRSNSGLVSGAVPERPTSYPTKGSCGLPTKALKQILLSTFRHITHFERKFENTQP